MTTKTELLGVIRAKCIDCCAGSHAEVRECAARDCALHPYRMGSDPNPARGGGNFNKENPQ
jgi:hypothetical protein